MDLKKESARVAYTLIANNSVVGLGDGLAVKWLAQYVIEGIRNGLQVKMYTSSLQTEKFLRQAGIEVPDIALTNTLDQYFDGCDQVDKDLNVVKSGSGIHTQEKLLAAMADKFIILADESKFVSKPDSKFPLVLEVLPEAACFVMKKMKDIISELRLSVRTTADSDKPIVTRNGNFLVDCFFPAWPALDFIHRQSKNIAGVVEVSLFYKMVHEAIIAGNDGVRRFKREMI